METPTLTTQTSTQSPMTPQDMKKGFESKWSLEANMPQVSESEMRSFRLSEFNEKFQEFLDQQTSQKHALYKAKRL